MGTASRAESCGRENQAGEGMSETFLTFMLSEFKTVRIRCKNSIACSGVIEMSMDNFCDLKKELGCPVCGLKFSSPRQTGLERLGQTIAFVKAQETVEHFQVEFVISNN
jgi:hypothetical protein